MAKTQKINVKGFFASALVCALMLILTVLLVMLISGYRISIYKTAKGNVFYLGKTYSGAPSSGTVYYGDGTYAKYEYDYSQLTYANGDVYTGDIASLFPHGNGTMEYACGDIYQGGFAYGKPSGTGKYTYASGSYVEGEFENGRPDGVCTLVIVYDTESDVFVGSFTQGIKNGYGNLVRRDGTTYKGNYYYGLRDGEGEITLANGNLYSGNFYNGSPNGQGTFKWSDGSYYIGNFENGVIDGYGTYFDLTTVFSGEFAGGIYDPTPDEEEPSEDEDPDGKSEGTFEDAGSADFENADTADGTAE